MASAREWTEETNSRGYEFKSCEGRHVCLSQLKEDHNDHGYLQKNIPHYPKFVDFNVSKVCHVTDENGLRDIFHNGGFRKPHIQDDNFLWWSLSVSEGDIADAEKMFLDKLFPDVRSQNQLPFLREFTISPAFREESRYGNFRFTFSLKALLYLYASKFCHSSSPVLRVLDTKLYKKEILYTVLVHPSHIKDYDKYPRLPCDTYRDVCGYFQGVMSWRCQAPSDNHRYKLEVDKDNCSVHVEELEKEVYYVWDHVAVAFHMEPDWILPVDRDRLCRSLSLCEVGEVNLMRMPNNALSLDDAKAVLQEVIESRGQTSAGQ